MLFVVKFSFLKVKCRRKQCVVRWFVFNYSSSQHYMYTRGKGKVFSTKSRQTMDFKKIILMLQEGLPSTSQSRFIPFTSPININIFGVWSKLTIPNPHAVGFTHKIPLRHLILNLLLLVIVDFPLVCIFGILMLILILFQCLLILFVAVVLKVVYIDP